MITFFAWLLATAPLSLAALGAVPSPTANRTPLRFADQAQAAALAALAVALIGAGVVAFHGPIRTGTLGIAGIGFAFHLDALSAVMAVLVAFVGAIVIRYSRNYLAGDPNHGRFVKWLCLTLAAVLLLILSGNLFLFALAWVGASLGLNKLLLFYGHRQGAVLAARKKFIASRVGDFCLAFAMILLYVAFGSLDHAAIFEQAKSLSQIPWFLHVAALFLALAALVKSAQFPTHGWLQEVMETPTPVSALLHAGVINAGGFLILRFSDVIALSTPSLDLLAIIGGMTALFGSLVMLTQTSIKGSLAYSTVAQMGFMMLQCGLGAFSSALLHIVAHSLYKAHAFLSSGSVIDLARASWTPSPGGKPHRARLIIAVAASLAAALIASTAFGASLTEKPGVFALGAIVLLGLTHLIANGIDERPNSYVIGRIVGGAALVAVAYFTLQLVADRLMAGSLPPTQALRGPLDLAIVALVLISFAGVTLFQGLLPGRDGAARWRALYAHVSNGFYVNTLANRWVLRFWPAPPAAPKPPRVWREAISAPDLSPLARGDLDAAIRNACGKIAPLWPLKHFVAVNPFLGFTDQRFETTAATLRRVAGVDMTPPRRYFRALLKDGVIEDQDLAAAITVTPGAPQTVEAVKQAAAQDAQPARRTNAVVATVSEVLDELADGDRQVARTAFMIDEISKWCAAYFDEGQASWRPPARELSPYAAWRAGAAHDLNPEAMGVEGFRATIAALPHDPVEAIAEVVRKLGVPNRAVADYLHRALFDIGGWAAYVRYLAWDNALYGRTDDRLVELLAIRVAWGYALFNQRQDPAFKAAWARAMADATSLPEDEAAADPDLTLDLVLQNAFEAAYQRRLLGRLRQGFARPPSAPKQPAIQAAFCIDVRSEIFRRALEAVCPEAETVGFAGFFGFPIEYVPIGQNRGGAQCPVLLKPAFTVCEAVKRADEEEATEIMGLRLLRRRAAKAWKSFKLSAISSFTYVETAGLLFAGKIVSDSMGWTRPVRQPALDGLDKSVAARVVPSLAPTMIGGRTVGFTPTQKLDMAEAVLRAMSMTKDFSRLVLLTGHGSTTVNNPHASGLDCGACGGHTGEANARVAAAILNDPEVRKGLIERGIPISDEVWFLGCLHDTTTDFVRIFDEELAPTTHARDLTQLRSWLDRAGALARMERSILLGAPKGGEADQAVITRSRDWSQIRPEWGLAGAAAFIAAPRSRTQGLDLGGRAFLHSYDWRADKNFSVLELIMTAPMVVASWINLQYFGSAANNAAFGSGEKTLHNVVGLIGVLEGNGGDLRVGLPMQSVHDGARFVHEPLRLNVFIEAPAAEIDRVLEKHGSVRDLVENSWIHLFRIAEDGVILRHVGAQDWRPC